MALTHKEIAMEANVSIFLNLFLQGSKELNFDLEKSVYFTHCCGDVRCT